MQILSKLTSSNFAICSQFIFHKNIPQILMYAEKKRLMRKHFFVTCLIRLELTELISFQPSIKPHLIQQLQRKQQWIYPLLFCSYRCCYYCCNCSFCYSCCSSFKSFRRTNIDLIDKSLFYTNFLSPSVTPTRITMKRIRNASIGYINPF